MSASGTIRAGRAFVEIMLNQTKLEQGLKQAQAKLKNFGQAITGVGKDMLAVATAAAVPIAMATRTFSGFDDQMRMVRAVSKATESEFQKLTATAEKLGRETSFTAQQVASGMTAMGRMGFSPGEIDNAISSVLNLARATGTELSEAAETAANNMRVFGLEASQMSSVADILTATANGSAQTLTDLAEGLKMAGPQAAAAKDNIVNVSGALGVLANMGIRGSLAGTALRKAYSQFAKVKIQNKLAEFNIKTVDDTGNLRSMPDIMADIAKKMNAMPTAQRLGFAEEIFDLRGSLAGLQLGGNIRQLDDFINRLKDVGGTASNTAKEMDSGIGGAFRIFMSAVEGCQIAIGRIIGEALGPYIQKMSAVLNKVAEWIAAHKEFVITAAKVTGAIAAAGVSLIALGLAFRTVALSVGVVTAGFSALKIAVLAPVAAVKGMVAAFGLLKTAMIAAKVAALSAWAAITTPAVLVGAVLGVLVAVVWQLSGAWQICTDAAKGFAGDVGTAFSSIGAIAKETWGVLKTALMSGDLAGAAKVGLAALKVAWLTGLAPLQKAWLDFQTMLSEGWMVTIYSILKLGNNLWYGLLTGLKSVGNSISDAWSFIWDGVIGAFESTMGYLKKKWIQFKGFFDSDVEVEAEIARVDAEMEQNSQTRRGKSEEESVRRKQESTALKSEWNASNKSIDDARNRELLAKEEQYQSALAASKSDLQKATEDWQAAIAEVKIKTEQRSEVTQAIAEKIRTQAIPGTVEAQTRIETARGEQAFGSWSAKELSSMFSGTGAEERTAKNTEVMLAELTDSNRYLKKIQANGMKLYYT